MENHTSIEGSFLFNNDELEVADILLNFADSILKSEASKALSLSWGVKRNSSSLGFKRTRSGSILRSVVSSPSAVTPSNGFAAKEEGKVNATAQTQALSPSTILLQSSLGSKRKRSGPILQPSSAAVTPTDGFATKENVKVNAAQALSPNSILLQPGSSESDEKPKVCHGRHSKKGREELVEEIKGLRQSRDLLRAEMEKVKSHYDILLAQNTQLKKLKQQVVSSSAPQTRVEPQLLKPESNKFGADLSSFNRIALPHQQRLIIHPTAVVDSQARKPCQFLGREFSQPLISSGNRVTYVNPDLNIPYGVDPTRTWELFHAKRVKYAEARMYRKNKRALKRLM